jgi:hypothetical protein
VTDPNELIQQPSLESFRIENRTSKSVLSAHAVVLNEAKDLWTLPTARTCIILRFAQDDNAVSLECCR